MGHFACHSILRSTALPFLFSHWTEKRVAQFLLLNLKGSLHDLKKVAYIFSLKMTI